MAQVEGKIIKGIAGFYYVDATDGNLYECKAKGVFRKEKIKPIIGDDVVIDIIDENDFSGNIVDVKPRRNKLIRPEVANIDTALLVCALKNPDPNFLMLDKLLLHFKKQNIPVIMCFNKEDIADDELINQALKTYENSGAKVVITSADKNQGIDELKGLLKGKITTIAGPSGVGKSSIINLLQSNVKMETGIISKKLNRGKHTTRHSEIIKIDKDTFIIDTPGFTSIDVFDIEYDELSGFYDEFSEYEQCYFTPCSHTHEPKCGVKDAVEDGLISEIRYNNYKKIYEELKIKSSIYR